MSVHLLIFIKLTVHKHHVANVKLWTEKYLDSKWQPKPPQKIACETPQLPLSFLPISQHMEKQVRDRLSTETMAQCPIDFRPEMPLLPALCCCGEKWKNYDEYFATGAYYALTFKKNVEVYVRKCVTGRCTHHFDGQSMGVFNYSGETLVSYAVLHDYENCCVRGGMAWKAYVEKSQRMYDKVYCESSLQMTFMSYPTFVKVCCICNFACVTATTGCQSIYPCSAENKNSAFMPVLWAVPTLYTDGWNRLC